jgi:hypothetical protein
MNLRKRGRKKRKNKKFGKQKKKRVLEKVNTKRKIKIFFTFSVK